MTHLFAWQLFGDFVKMCSWLLAFVMLAKAMTKLYVTTEILFTLSYVFIGYLFVNYNGIIGLTQAYLCNYILYMITMFICFRNILLKNNALFRKKIR